MGSRNYITPSDDELDCCHDVSPSEYVRGFLRLPSTTGSGRVRFVENISKFDPSTDLFPQIPVSLMDGSSGTPACLLNCFVTGHRFSMPTPPPYPLTMLVNEALIGSNDAGLKYDRATVRCTELLDFLGSSVLSAQHVAEVGPTVQVRASASGADWSLGLNESAEVESSDATRLTMRWHGEIVLEGQPKSLPEWGQWAVEMLHLFSFLLDRPLMPDQICTQGDLGRVDYYASWPKREAPRRTMPLLSLEHVKGRFDDLVGRWNYLLEKAHDFVDHFVDFQLYRQRYTLPDQVLLLFRCLELYHAYADRFDSRSRPKADHRMVVKTVTDAFSNDFQEEHGEWIKGALSEANRKRLVTQVAEILADLGPQVVERCYIADADHFASIAKGARNYFTHPSGKQPPEIPEGRDLLIFVQRLWFVVRACVSVELGLSHDEIAGALKRSASKHYLLK